MRQGAYAQVFYHRRLKDFFFRFRVMPLIRVLLQLEQSCLLSHLFSIVEQEISRSQSGLEKGAPEINQFTIEYLRILGVLIS